MAQYSSRNRMKTFVGTYLPEIIEEMESFLQVKEVVHIREPIQVIQTGDGFQHIIVLIYKDYYQ